MALALNNYTTKTGIATTGVVEFYKAPVGYTGVVLLSNIANVGNTLSYVTCIHSRTISINGIDTTINTEGIKDFPIESNDSASIFKGKLILEPGDSLKIYSNNNSSIKYIFSILETLN
jgi:hypothetical protein